MELGPEREGSACGLGCWTLEVVVVVVDTGGGASGAGAERAVCPAADALATDADASDGWARGRAWSSSILAMTERWWRHWAVRRESLGPGHRDNVR
jgi:hypothetical protein